MTEINELEIKNLPEKTSISKFTKFFSGFFISIFAIYLVIIGVLGAIYGADIFGMIILMSIYAHIMLFPFLIYSLVGGIFIMLSDDDFRKTTRLMWKVIAWSVFACIIIIAFSEFAHSVGLWGSRINLNWK